MKGNNGVSRPYDFDKDNGVLFLWWKTDAFSFSGLGLNKEGLGYLLLGKNAKVGSQKADAVDVHADGRSGPDSKLAVTVMEDLPCDKLASVLEGLMPYHTREKMHRVRGGEARKATVPRLVNKLIF